MTDKKKSTKPKKAEKNLDKKNSQRLLQDKKNLKNRKSIAEDVNNRKRNSVVSTGSGSDTNRKSVSVMGREDKESKVRRKSVTPQSNANVKQKRKSSSSSDRDRTASQPARKRKRSDDDSVQMVSVRQNTKWLPVKQTTVRTVTQMVDANISHVLNLCSKRCYEDIQDHLATLKSRFVGELTELKAPVASTEYSAVENIMASLDKDLDETTDHIERMDAEIDRIQGLLDAGKVEESRMRKTLTVAEAKLTQQANSGGLESDVLNLPVYNSWRKTGTNSLNQDKLLRESIAKTLDAKEELQNRNNETT